MSEAESIHQELIEELDRESARKRADAEVWVIKLAGSMVVITPVLWMALSYAAAAQGIKIELDDRILTVALASSGAIMTFAFGKEALKKLVSK